MSSSPSPGRREATTVLRGSAAAGVTLARLDGDLRGAAYADPVLAGVGVDPRLVDPRLEPAFAAAVGQAVEEGRVAGYARGVAEGRAAAAAEAAAVAAEEAARLRAREQGHDDQVAVALAAVAAACAGLDARQGPRLAEIESAVLDAAYHVATALAGRELVLSAEPHAEGVARAMRLVAPGEPLVVHLHPADASALGDPARHPLTAGRDVRVVADASLRPGDCLVDAGATRVDARLSAALARVREVLA